MDNLENNFMTILVILFVCYIISVLVYKPKKHDYPLFGYKCMKNTLGPNDMGYCLKVDEAPSEENDVYSNALDCLTNCSNTVPKDDLPFGYKCMKNTLGPSGMGYCLKVDESPNKENDIYSNSKDCLMNCSNKK